MKEEQDRYWNSFGTREPKWNTGYPHSITVEINVPKGVNRRIGGVFAIDENRKIYLLHRGAIGGGRKGIGKSLFIRNFPSDQWIPVKEREFATKLVKIAAIESKRFPNQIANFVHEVERIKRLATSPVRQSLSIEARFKDEFFGTRKFSISKEIEAACDHGIVVRSLAKRLKAKGLAVGNVSPMDLYILNKDKKVETLFEVKTEDTLTSCYQAIGQLFFYSARLGVKPHLVAVFPETLSRECRDVFKKLKIECLTYKWISDQPRFSTSLKLEKLNDG